MYLRQAKNLLAVSVLWVALGGGCKKDEPEPYARSCNDGTCCMTDKAGYDFAKYFENEPADLIAGELNKDLVVSVQLKSVYPTREERPDAIYQLDGGLLCELSADKVRGLAPSAEWQGPFTYKYRVWGSLYTLHALTFTGQPISFFYITRIEKAP